MSSGPAVVSKNTSVPTVVLESDKQSTSEQATSPMPTLGIPRPLTPGMLTPGRLSYAEAVSGTPKIQKGNESSETVVSSKTSPSNPEVEDGSEVDEQESEENEATSLVQTKNVRFRDSVEEMSTETEDLTSTSQSESTDKESEQSITEKVENGPGETDFSVNDLDGPGSSEVEKSGQEERVDQLKPVRGKRDFNLVQKNADKVLENRLRSNSK